MYCQTCGAKNNDEAEYCSRCHHKLLVVSGDYVLEDQEAFDSNPEEQFSFDEHLLERISILEEVVRRMTDTVRQSLGTLYKLEQKILVNQTGITTLRDLLENKQVLRHEEWSELWESRMEQQLLALEKRERFAEIKDQVAALYRGDQREEFRQRLENAEYALLVFDIAEALVELEAAHALDPANHELSFFLGETFFNEGDEEAALSYFNRVLLVKSDHFESLVYGGVLCHEHGHPKRAEELLKRAVVHYPDAFLPAFSLGAVYASRGLLAQAAIYLERAVYAEPLPQAYYLLGSCCYEMGKVTAAIRNLQETVRLDPAFAEAHQLLGLAYLDRRWYRKALTALGDAQLLRPHQLDYRELVQWLVDAETAPPTAVEAEEALQRGQSKEALSAYRRALAQDPENPALLVAYAMACLELGRTRDIEPVIDKVLGLEPGERLRASAYATLIEALRLEGKYREGNRIGHLLLSEGRSDFAKTIAYFEIAFNLAEMGEDLDQALSFARRSLELAPEEIRYVPLAALGWVHYKRREFPESIDCLTRSNALDSSPRTLTHLGMALLASGEREKARNVLAEARTAGKDNDALPRRLATEGVLEALKDGSRQTGSRQTGSRQTGSRQTGSRQTRILNEPPRRIKS